ncbi:hypothetical protein GQ55_5G333900 [Panicum hallii var. hallii]|uniref:Uncharacterized protein n=1 Tax=Panicum hallii var. hallii TaxID=1504633 RepID=A0A2T7DLY1_9POAL|nr:hypothetical protein GQ55_5G333900 [Panicum hallii var. hallii]
MLKVSNLSVPAQSRATGALLRRLCSWPSDRADRAVRRQAGRCVEICGKNPPCLPEPTCGPRTPQLQ